MAHPLSTSIAWAWVLETLSDFKDVEIEILHALMRAVPDLSASLNASKIARERVSLRLLEEWMGSNPTGAEGEASEIDLRLDSVSDFDAIDVLKEVVTSSNLGKCGTELRQELSQFILKKRAALPKCGIQKLKDSLNEEGHQSALSKRERIRANNGGKNDTAKRLKASGNNCEIQPLEENPAAGILENGDKNDATTRLKASGNSFEIQPLEENPAAVILDNGDNGDNGEIQPLEGNSAAVILENGDNGEIQPLEENPALVILENGNEALEKDLPELRPNDAAETTHQVPQDASADEVEDGGEHGVVTETLSSSDGDHDMGLDDERFAAEKNMFLSSQNPVTHDSLATDWTEQGFCVKCEEGGVLLTCSSKSCPLAVHESCLGSSVSFEDNGSFYCPFCSYTRAHAVYRKAKKAASLARKALSAFMGRDPVHRNKHKQQTAKVPAKPKEARTMSSTDCPDKIDTDQLHRDIVHGHPCEREAENHQAAKAAVDGNDNNVSCREVDTSLNGDADGVFVTKGNTETVDNLQGLSLVNHQKHIEPVPSCSGDSSPSREAETSPINEKPARGRKKVALRTKISDAPHPSTRNVDADETARNENGEKLSSGKCIKRQRPAKRYANPVFPYARRNKLRWTTEEEDALKEAICRYSRSGDKNIPWTMILESGHHVFHKTRTPVDLKDKWRNITVRKRTAT